MPDRADYLARTLLTRLHSLEGVLREDAAEENEKDRRRAELVEKVLAIEAGVIDSVTVNTVLAAVPLARRENFSDREKSEFAAFLRQRLPADTR